MRIAFVINDRFCPAGIVADVVSESGHEIVCRMTNGPQNSLLTRAEDFAAVNKVYETFFEKPYPNHATVVVAGLLAPGLVIEIVAYAHISA